MALFAQYAVAATEEALEDADWKPTSHEQREATVSRFSSTLPGLTWLKYDRLLLSCC
jgi:3-oxoacyl-(acyl-carrier-protein) synthase